MRLKILGLVLVILGFALMIARVIIHAPLGFFSSVSFPSSGAC
jgi:hypothetical protein